MVIYIAFASASGSKRSPSLDVRRDTLIQSNDPPTQTPPSTPGLLDPVPRARGHPVDGRHRLPHLRAHHPELYLQEGREDVQVLRTSPSPPTTTTPRASCLTNLIETITQPHQTTAPPADRLDRRLALPRHLPLAQGRLQLHLPMVLGTYLRLTQTTHQQAATHPSVRPFVHSRARQSNLKPPHTNKQLNRRRTTTSSSCGSTPSWRPPPSSSASCTCASRTASTGTSRASATRATRRTSSTSTTRSVRPSHSVLTTRSPHKSQHQQQQHQHHPCSPNTKKK